MHVSSPTDRSMNIVLFGLPEQFRLETRKTVDKVHSFLCGASTPIRDLIRLGKYVEDQSRPSWSSLLTSGTKEFFLPPELISSVLGFLPLIYHQKRELSVEPNSLVRWQARLVCFCPCSRGNSLNTSSDGHPANHSLITVHKSVSTDMHLPD